MLCVDFCCYFSPILQNIKKKFQSVFGMIFWIKHKNWTEFNFFFQNEKKNVKKTVNQINKKETQANSLSTVLNKKLKKRTKKL